MGWLRRREALRGELFAARNVNASGSGICEADLLSLGSAAMSPLGSSRPRCPGQRLSTGVVLKRSAASSFRTSVTHRQARAEAGGLRQCPAPLRVPSNRQKEG